jgi:hypothetical protein
VCLGIKIKFLHVNCTLPTCIPSHYQRIKVTDQTVHGSDVRECFCMFRKSSGAMLVPLQWRIIVGSSQQSSCLKLKQQQVRS